MDVNKKKETEPKGIVGEAGSGKTASLNMLAHLVQRQQRHERIVSIEDTVELKLDTNFNDDK